MISLSSLTTTTNKFDILTYIQTIYDTLPDSITFQNSGLARDNFLLAILQQEINLLNNLLKTVRNSLYSIKQGLEGNFHSLETLRSVYDQIVQNKVPTEWKYFPSALPFQQWTEDLVSRAQFFQNWIDTGTPSIFWLGAFAYPQAIFTYALLQGAKKLKVDVENLVLDFEVMNSDVISTEEGILLSGLFLEGARWDNKLEELEPSGTFCQKMPPILCRARQPVRSTMKGDSSYLCPVYRTSDRGSSNLVTYIKLPSSNTEKHWVKRSVVLLSHFDINE